MFNFFRILIVLSSLFNIVLAQEIFSTEIFPLDTCNCRFVCWSEDIDSPKELSKERIFDFLKTIKKECSTKVEFTEMSNELIFLLLLYSTNNLLNVLEENQSVLEIPVLFDMIENPIKDDIKLNEIFILLNKSENHSQIKAEILKRIKLSIDKIH